MKHEFTQRVYYADTDAYEVVWHGTYLRWFEMGRVELCTLIGLDLKTMQAQDVAFPVTDINVKFKSSARLDDTVLVETWISKVTPLSCVFSQTIKNKETGLLRSSADVTVVAVNKAGKLYRRFPENVKECFERGLECKE